MIEFTLIIMRWSSSQIKEHVTIFWQRHYWIMVGFDGPIISMISPSNQSNPYKTLNNWTTKGKFFHTCFFCLLFLETLWLTWYLEISPTRANRGACHLYISHGLHWKHNLWYFNFSLEPIIFIITCPTSFLKIFKSRAHLKLVGRLQFMFKCLEVSLTENILDNKLQSLWLNNKFALNSQSGALADSTSKTHLHQYPHSLFISHQPYTAHRPSIPESPPVTRATFPCHQLRTSKYMKQRIHMHDCEVFC